MLRRTERDVQSIWNVVCHRVGLHSIINDLKNTYTSVVNVNEAPDRMVLSHCAYIIKLTCGKLIAHRENGALDKERSAADKLAER